MLNQNVTNTFVLTVKNRCEVESLNAVIDQSQIKQCQKFSPTESETP